MAKYFLGRITEQQLARRIEHLHRADGVNQDDAINSGVDDGAQAFATLAQRLLSRFSFGEVADDANKNRFAVFGRFTD